MSTMARIVENTSIRGKLQKIRSVRQSEVVWSTFLDSQIILLTSLVSHQHSYGDDQQLRTPEVLPEDLFSFQHPHGDSQQAIAPVSEDPMSSPGLQMCTHTSTIELKMQAKPYLYKMQRNIFKN